MGYSAGKKSLKRLEDARPDLARGILLALKEYSEVDFSIIEVKRSKNQQQENIKAGVSWTMNSKHLIQKDGFVHAVDLLGWVNKKSNNDEEVLIKIAEAMRKAFKKLGIRLIWGGCWQEISCTTETLENLIKAYRKKRGSSAKVDMLHFEVRGRCPL